MLILPGSSNVLIFQQLYSFDHLPAYADSHDDSANENSILITSISTRYNPEFPSFHVFGELENNLKSPVQNVLLNVTFFDSNGNITGTALGYPYTSMLRPGEKSTFEIVAYGNAASRLLNFSYYKISRTWDEVQQPKEPLLRLDVSSMFVDPCGYYHVEGSVTNLGNNRTNGIGVSGAFYNKENQIVASAFTTIKDSLDPTKRVPFTFVIEKEALPHFAHYSLNVQSLEYASIIAKEEESLSNNDGSPASTAGSGRITVWTDAPTYGLDAEEIRIIGKVPNANQDLQGSLVSIRIITASGLVPYLVTAPLSPEGDFSRVLKFTMDDSLQGQVFRVRADYSGSVAENTFSIRYNNDTETGIDPASACNDAQDIAISQLNALPEGFENTGNVTDYLSGKEIEVDSMTTLSTATENRLSRPQSVIIIFEVFDASGVVVFIHAGNWTLAPNSHDQASVSWMPDETGEFRIKSFVISNLDQPWLLSTAAPLAINVVREG